MLESSHRDYNWNAVDQMVFFPMDWTVQTFKFRCLRYAILPSRTQDQAVYLTNFKKFMSTISHSLDFSKLDITISDSFLTIGEYLDLSELILETPRVSGVRVELPQVRTDRSEWFRLEFDSHFVLGSCFHFDVYWLFAAGTQIAALLQRMQNSSTLLGIDLIRVPCKERLSSIDPFHSEIVIQFPSKSSQLFVETWLTSDLDFVIDLNPYQTEKGNITRQYLHLSGAATIQATKNLCLIWISNTLSMVAVRAEAQKIYRRFCKQCEISILAERFLVSTIERAVKQSQSTKT